MNNYQIKIDKLTAILEDQEIALGLRRKRRTAEAKTVFNKAIYWLVTEGLNAKIGNRKGTFSVSRNKNHYAKENPDRTGLVPSGLSYSTAICDQRNSTGALESLILNDYLKLEKGGHYNRSGDQSKSAATKYSATEKLIKFFGDDQIQSLFVPMPRRETIILKGASVDPKISGDIALRSYKDTPQTTKMRENLDLINKNMLRHWYDLYIADETYRLMQKEIAQRRARRLSDREKLQSMNLANRTLRRVFARGSFEKGGRFYGGWWQNIPSAYRSVITINGYRTVEADYSQFHPNILYHLKQAKLDGRDAYERIIGSEYRDLAKQIFNACLNSAYETSRPPKGLKISHTGFKWREIIEHLFKAHPKIEDAFFTDEGMKLQYYDSQMAELVLLSFAKGKRPILPVHDSFLVLEDDEELLLERMEAAYQQILGEDIKIDIKKAKLVQLPPSEDNVFEDVMAYSGWLNRNDDADAYYGRQI